MRTALRIVIVLLSLVFMAVVMLAEWDKIQAATWTPRADLFALSLLGLVGIFFLDAFGWHLVLKALGHHLPIARAIQVWLVSSLARYIPGGVWSYASRITLAKAEGVTVSAAGLSLYLETLLLMASSLAIGSLALLWDVGVTIDPWLAATICAAFGLTLHPRMVAQLRRLPGRVGKAMAHVKLPTMRRTMLLYAYYLVFWILFGAIFVGFVAATHPVAPAHWFPIGAGIALGFFVGFILVFVPGGIGVRESVLYLLLLPFLPPAVSLVVAIGSRLWIMAGEAISLLIILLYGKLSPRSR